MASITNLVPRVSKFPKTILLTECNRGIGIKLLNLLSKQFPQTTILATGDNIERCREVRAIKYQTDNVFLFDMNVDSELSVDTAEKDMGPYLKDGLSMIINNMALDLDEEVTGLESIPISHHVDRSMLDVSGPHLIAKEFIPHLVKGALNKKDDGLAMNYKGLLVNISNFQFPKNSTKSLNSSYKMARKIVNNSILDSTQKLGIVTLSIFPDKMDNLINLSSTFTVQHLVDFITNVKPEHHGGYFDFKGSTLNF